MGRPWIPSVVSNASMSTRLALIAALLREKELIEALEQARKEIERLRKGAKRK